MRICIADFYVDIECNDGGADTLPNLKPFIASRNETDKHAPICRIHTGQHVDANKTAPTLCYDSDGRTVRLWLMPDRCIISLSFHDSRNVYSLEADRHWNSVLTDWKPDEADASAALNDLIMVSFVYSSAFHNCTAIHASCVAIGDCGCAFIGPSGIGKSTHSKLWLQNIPGTRLINDDQPIVRLHADGQIYIYGSPWSGKTRCYRNEGVKLKSIFFMEQASENEALRLSGIETFRRLMPATSLIGRDTVSFEHISRTQASIAGMIPAYLLRNRPDKEAAELSNRLFVISQTTSTEQQ